MSDTAARNSGWMAVRAWLSRSVRDEGRGLPAWVQVTGFLVFVGSVFVSAWVSLDLLGPYGPVLGGPLGILIGSALTTQFFRSYRSQQQHDLAAATESEP